MLVVAEGTGASTASYWAMCSKRLATGSWKHLPFAANTVMARQTSLMRHQRAWSVLAVEMTKLRDRRAGEAHTALQVLTGARDHLSVERLRYINVLTTLVRGHDLGLDARRALTTEQINTIRGMGRI